YAIKEDQRAAYTCSRTGADGPDLSKAPDQVLQFQGAPVSKAAQDRAACRREIRRAHASADRCSQTDARTGTIKCKPFYFTVAFVFQLNTLYGYAGCDCFAAGSFYPGTCNKLDS